MNILDSLYLTAEALNDALVNNGGFNSDSDISKEIIKEMNCVCYACQVIEGEYSADDRVILAKGFFRNYDSLKFKSDIIELAHNRVTFLISSPH